MPQVSTLASRAMIMQAASSSGLVLEEATKIETAVKMGCRGGDGGGGDGTGGDGSGGDGGAGGGSIWTLIKTAGPCAIEALLELWSRSLRQKLKKAAFPHQALSPLLESHEWQLQPVPFYCYHWFQAKALEKYLREQQ